MGGFDPLVKFHLESMLPKWDYPVYSLSLEFNYLKTSFATVCCLYLPILGERLLPGRKSFPTGN